MHPRFYAEQLQKAIQDVEYLRCTPRNLRLWRVLPLKSEKLTFAIDPRLILGGGRYIATSKWPPLKSDPFQGGSSPK